MLKKEEIKEIESLKELSDEQIKSILDLAQSKGDGVKKKYKLKELEKEEEIKKLNEEIKKLSNNNENNENNDNNEDNNDENNGITLLTKKIEQLQNEIANITKEKEVGTTKNKLLEIAKEKGFDLKHASILFDTLGKNLEEDFDKYESLLVKQQQEEEESETPPGGDNGSAGDSFEFSGTTGVPEIDAILQGKDE